MVPTATHEICGRPHDQQQTGEPRGRDGDLRGSELDGGLARKWVGLPRVKGRRRNGGQVGDLGLERCAQGGIGLANEGTWHEGLARTHPGHRPVRTGGGEAAQNAKWAADQNQEDNAQGSVFYKKYGAVTSKIAMAGFMPSGLHGERCMGMPPSRVKSFRTTTGRCLPGKHAGRSLTWRLAVHQCDPIHPCRVEPIVAWAEAVWDEQLDDADLQKAWRRQQRLVGAIGGLEAVVEQGQWPDGCHYHVLEATGLDVASPHDLRHCKWARGGLTADLPQGRHKAQATVDCELALWREWAEDDERKELFPCPLLEPVLLANKRAQRRPQEAPRDQGGVECDSNTAGIAEHPFCVKCEPAVLGSAQHRLWACPAYRETRFDLPPTH